MECSVEIRLGEKKPAMVGFDSLISMQPQLCVDGEALTKKDVELLLAQTEGLAFLKGKWVEVNHKSLQDRSRAPKTHPRKIDDETINKIRKRLKQFRWTDLLMAYQVSVEKDGYKE